MKTAAKLLILLTIIAFAVGAVRYFVSREPVSHDSTPIKPEPAARKEVSHMPDESSSMPYHYLLPRWYGKNMMFVGEPQVTLGGEFEVVASLSAKDAGMQNLETRFIPSDGLTIVDGDGTWNSSLEQGQTKEFKVKVKWTGNKETTERLRFFFECDFPRDDLLSYVEANSGSRYDHPELR